MHSGGYDGGEEYGIIFRPSEVLSIVEDSPIEVLREEEGVGVQSGTVQDASTA